MGACEFQTSRKGSDMKAAYAAAVRDATDEYGHDGYNGTISTTCGVAQAVYTPMTAKGASAYANLHAPHCEKWGAAMAIPVGKDADFTLKTVKFTIELPAIRKAEDEWDQDRDTTEWDLREAAEKQAFERYGERVHQIAVKPGLKTKMVTETQTGKSVTRYRLRGTWHTRLHATRAEAVKYAKEYVAKDGYGQVEVEAVRYWPESNTTHAVVITKRTVAAVADVTVTLATPKTRPGTIGWVFYGMAAE